MSRTLVKTASRSTKPAGRNGKKSAKAARPPAKKPAKSVRATNAHTARGVSASKSRFKHEPKIIRTSSPPVQPVAAHEIARKTHKYQIGQMVYYTSPTFGRAAASGSYTVVKLLPSEGDDYQYRIKSTGEAFERVAKESQLDRA
jgi:hypothetical protein